MLLLKDPSPAIKQTLKLKVRKLSPDERGEVSAPNLLLNEGVEHIKTEMVTAEGSIIKEKS